MLCRAGYNKCRCQTVTCSVRYRNRATKNRSLRELTSESFVPVLGFVDVSLRQVAAALEVADGRTLQFEHRQTSRRVASSEDVVRTSCIRTYTQHNNKQTSTAVRSSLLRSREVQNEILEMPVTMKTNLNDVGILSSTNVHRLDAMLQSGISCRPQPLPGVCVRVCHKPVLYRNGWTDKADFWHGCFLRPKGNSRIYKISAPPSGNILNCELEKLCQGPRHVDRREVLSTQLSKGER